MSKLKFDFGPYLGSIELERWQELELLNHSLNLDTVVEQYGLLVTHLDTNEYGTEWEPSIFEDIKVMITSGKAIIKDSDGIPRRISLASNTEITLPDSADSYKILLSYSTKNTEEGTVTLTNGSDIVNGVNTKFTKLFAANRRIIVEDVGYVVLSVQSDTQLTLETNYMGITGSGKSFKTGGWFPTYPAGINDNLIYEYDSAQIVIKNSATAKTNYEYLICEVVVEDGVIQELIDKRAENIFKFFLNTPTILETPASTFKVGGRYVELENDIPPQVINFRVVDIYGASLFNIDPTMLLEVSNKAIKGATNQLNVALRWGYNNITGNGGSNQFTINTAGLSFTENQLAGYFLYIPALTKNLKITANAATGAGTTVLTVTEEGGTAWNGTGVVVSSGNPAIINHNATDYEVTAIPILGGVQDPVNIVHDSRSYGESPVLQETRLKLDVGTYYLIKIRAKRGRQFSAYSELEAGSFIKYGVTQNYAKPILVRHPQISSAGLSVEAFATWNGFSVIIPSGWNEAEEFEIVYSVDPTKANFAISDGNNTKETFQNRLFQKTTDISQRYHMKVRPLISGHSVAAQHPSGDPLTLISGVAGPQNQQVISQTYFSHRTYSGDVEVTAWTGNIGFIQLSNIKSPALSSTVATAVAQLEGNIITIDGNDYMIVADLGNALEIEKIGTSPNLSVTTYTFEIGTSKRGRRILRAGSYPINYKLVRMDFDCDVKRGDDVTLRVYQESRESAADSMIITLSETGYAKDIDIDLSGTYGARILIADLFDPAVSGAKNTGEVSGLLTIYARPLSGGGIGIGGSDV